jgi:hypothetical protein
MSDLLEVRIVSLPMEVYIRAREHHEGLTREFTLIRLADPETSDVPHRLLQLAEEVTERYSPFTAPAERELAEAEERGQPQVDLTYHVPPSAAEAAQGLAALLDEADEYCRAGRHLLTLVTPPETQAFRRWYLGEFVRQIGGEEPLAWPEFKVRDGQ